MKKYFIYVFFLLFVFNFAVTAQTDEGYKFSIVKQLPATSVKNQAATGTCYTFSTISMLESELLRMGKGEYDLSEMFMVRSFYSEKADRYIRFHGTIGYPTGGEANNTIDYFSKVGLVPEEVYSGLNYGSPMHNHGEIHAVLENYIQTITNKGNKVSPMWQKGLDALLNTWFGEYPANFTYKGKSYTPQSFAAELGLNPDDYILITSCLHKPMYKKSVLDMPDNWDMSSAYNVPLDDFEKIIDYSINNGYTLVWSSDLGGGQAVSSDAVYVVPEKDVTRMKREEISALFKNVIAEKTVTPEMRQKAYDTYQTTDDHAMHLVGIAKDQNGNKFYYVKNSWGVNGKYNGYLYVSIPFIRLSTTSLLLNKSGVPKEILQKLNVN